MWAYAVGTHAVPVGRRWSCRLAWGWLLHYGSINGVPEIASVYKVAKDFFVYQL